MLFTVSLHSNNVFIFNMVFFCLIQNCANEYQGSIPWMHDEPMNNDFILNTTTLG